MDKIFDTKEDSDIIDFEKDYFLPIGTSPAFSDYNIKINPDRFFGKHAAILGNTGSGKSCTVSSIIQTLFRFSFPVQEKNENGEKELRTKNLENAHFIIFDTNGEYKKAFGFDENNPDAEKSIINSFYIDKDGMKIPYWFMNFDDFDYLFEPSSGTQAPLLKSALGLAKDEIVADYNSQIPLFYIKRINSFIDLCESNKTSEVNRIVFEELRTYIDYFGQNDFDFDVKNIVDSLNKIPTNSIVKNGNFYNGTINPQILKAVVDTLKDSYKHLVGMYYSLELCQSL